MKDILFVDDETSVLDGLKRMLRPLRREWNMRFAPSGEVALAEIAHQPCDVIVSDMRMPGMDGVALLQEVADVNPKTIRIALSGHAEMEMILESVRAAHQYLAKPCDAATLKATIERAFALDRLLTDETLTGLVGEIGALPSLPSLYSEVMQEISRPDSSLAKVGDIIGQDIAMSAKVLQLVNSAFFGLRCHVDTPAHAATVLGMDVMRGLVLGVKVFAEFDQSTDVIDIHALWQRSSRTAVLAKEIAKLEGQPTKCGDFAFMAGLLHDLGRLVLAAKLPERCGEVAALAADQGLADYRAEQRVLGCTHMEIGAYLLGLWGLPNPIVETVAFHHEPIRSVGDSFSPLTAVHVAQALIGAGPVGDVEDEDLTGLLDISYLQRLNLADRAPRWLALCTAMSERDD